MPPCHNGMTSRMFLLLLTIAPFNSSDIGMVQVWSSKRAEGDDAADRHRPRTAGFLRQIGHAAGQPPPWPSRQRPIVEGHRPGVREDPPRCRASHFRSCSSRAARRARLSRFAGEEAVRDHRQPRISDRLRSRSVSGKHPSRVLAAQQAVAHDVTASELRARDPPGPEQGDDQRWQVSWLARHCLSGPAFPVSQWLTVGLRLCAYSCGCSHGLGPDGYVAPCSLLFPSREPSLWISCAAPASASRTCSVVATAAGGVGWLASPHPA